ncbi:MAG TPA: MYXO-CTERM sorting domain-containing protein, partial [Kofleriaceae bacterium]
QGEAARAAVFDAAMTHFGVAKDPDRIDEEPPTGCGCGTTGDPSALLLLAIAMLGWRARPTRSG